jgi:hypothetical protein
LSGGSARLSQQEVAARLGRNQPFASAAGRGQNPVTIVEFLEFCEAIGFDPHAVIRQLVKSTKSDERWRKYRSARRNKQIDL